MLKKLAFKSSEVVYFEHNLQAVKSASSIGIKSYHHDKDEKDLVKLEKFLFENLITTKNE